MNFNKLVRNRIPQIIEKEGYKTNYKIMNEEEYICALDQKLMEEAFEYQQDKSLGELADILEVIYAICKARGYSKKALQEAYQKKHVERGGFDKKIFLISKE
ncbi:nucleoside triphosphate pyrophosphohydrolase [Konateibacter massiliensis]|uniref:nucleoside triphosphate pyrophosphohydrolase n=1 Tax=Konateibacter massiliensis TaxID=2002841 RepID=UPI000C1624D1|nr:nucleoside triphosphate pyrophosphohydrolase [Konateibacter massiliensis]